MGAGDEDEAQMSGAGPDWARPLRDAAASAETVKPKSTPPLAVQAIVDESMEDRRRFGARVRELEQYVQEPIKAQANESDRVEAAPSTQILPAPSGGCPGS